jgi:hypothetical protein
MPPAIASSVPSRNVAQARRPTSLRKISDLLPALPPTATRSGRGGELLLRLLKLRSRSLAGEGASS